MISVNSENTFFFALLWCKSSFPDFNAHNLYPSLIHDKLPSFPDALKFFSLLDTFEMVSEDDDGKLVFKVNYHYMSQVKNASDANSAARARRLAQEAVTLSTSLPLSSSSSVFVRCDEERLDIMKVRKQSWVYFSLQLGVEVRRKVPEILGKTRNISHLL